MNPEDVDLMDGVEVSDGTEKFWRFAVKVFDIRGLDPTPKWKNPVPVRSGDRLVGFASLFCPGIDDWFDEIYANAALVYGVPERLTVQNGEKVWALPVCRFEPRKSGDGFRVVEIQALELRTDCINPSFDPIPREES